MDTQNSPAAESTVKSSRRKFYTSVSAVAVAVVLLASFVVAPPGENVDLRLTYTVGERMVYEKTEVIVNQSLNTSTPETPEAADTDSFNSTITLEVLNEADEGYTVNENMSPANVSKNIFYSVILPSGGPLIFWNASNNPMLAAYLEEISVKTGEVWTLPLDCANASLGLTGQVIVAFAGIEEVTVPAGTYRAIRVEVTSSVLTVNPDSDTPYQQGMTLQFNATTYLEQSTCRLIKTSLSMETHLSSLDTENVASVHIEETLIQHTKP
jgi:hypothetical protein